MYFVERGKAKDIIVEVLRLGFATNQYYPFITHVTDTQERFPTEVEIYKEFPQKKIYVPSLVVSFTDGDGLIRTLGEEVLEEGFSDFSINGITRNVLVSTLYGGEFSLSLDVDIRALETTTRDEIADWATMYLRWMFKDKILERGIEIKDIRLKGETTETIGTNLVYVTGMTIDIYSEWEHEVRVGMTETLEAICQVDVSTYLQDGVTYFS